MTTEFPEDGQKLVFNLNDASPPNLQACGPDSAVGESGLTSDNLHLSQPTSGDLQSLSAVISDRDSPDAKLLQFLQAARAPNTLRAYQSDVEHFTRHGGQLPADDLMVARYLASHAGQLSIATLQRRLVAIRSVHVAGSVTDPTMSELVRLMLRGIRRMHGRPQRRAIAITPADLRAIVASLSSSNRDIRDAAILLIGFAGAFRRSELVAIDCKDVTLSGQGASVRIRRSKTDQQGLGRRLAIPRATGSPICPVAALQRWLSVAAIREGAIFRAVTKAGSVLPGRLSSSAIASVVKERIQAIGKDTSRYSGHSLRAGFVTAAAITGVPQWRIKGQTGHLSDAVLAGYIREGELTGSLALLSLFA